MAAPILSTLRPSIARPAIRSSSSSLVLPLLSTTHQQHARRPNHQPPPPPWRAIARRPFSYASALTLTHDFVLTVHAATGAHWLLTIPAFAVATSLLFQLPLMALARRRAQRQSSVEPLMNAWRIKHILDQRAADADKAARLTASRSSSGDGRSSVHTDTAARLLEANVALMATEKRLKRKFGVPSASITIAAGWLVSMPAFLTATDTLRRMSGASAGPLSLLVPDAADLAPTMLEPSLHNGGMAWFADLAAADPLMALPLATSALMFWRVWPRGNRAWMAALLGTDRSGPREGRYIVSLMAENGPLLERQRAQAQLALSRLVTFVLPLVPLLAAGLPSSVFIFWMTSIVASQALRKAVAARMPIQKWTVEAKKRNVFLDMPE